VLLVVCLLPGKALQGFIRVLLQPFSILAWRRTGLFAMSNLSAEGHVWLTVSWHVSCGLSTVLLYAALPQPLYTVAVKSVEGQCTVRDITFCIR
jgi:hypothetical protein